MKPLFLLVLLAVSIAAGRGGQSPSTPWVLYKWGNSGQYRPYSTTGTFTFPSSGNNVAYPAFLTTIKVTNLLGNLTGRTASATISITATGDPDFVWGGLLSGWNTQGLPANCRLFLSTSSDAYSNAGYKACPDCYWWATQAWVEISPLTGTTTISSTLDQSLWSNAIGQSNPEFYTAIANVHQIGLAFGGGSFYDVGVAVLNGTGTGTFRLESFDVQ